MKEHCLFIITKLLRAVGWGPRGGWLEPGLQRQAWAVLLGHGDRAKVSGCYLVGGFCSLEPQVGRAVGKPWNGEGKGPGARLEKRVVEADGNSCHLVPQSRACGCVRDSLGTAGFKWQLGGLTSSSQASRRAGRWQAEVCDHFQPEVVDL